MDVITVKKYLATKLQSLNERQEIKDVYHLLRLFQNPQTRDMTRDAIERADPLIVIAAAQNATSLNNLAELYVSISDYEKAQPC